MLLWVTVLALAGAVVALFERRLDERTLGAALGAQAALALGFFAFLLFASNPFERLDPAPLDGRGLNPLLQDPGLAFHPPTLYLGYVGLSVAFSLAVGGLIRGNVGPAIARAMRPWVLAAWILLTLGITAGSYWAYYELGWGGWWFWDPVENASLMPWLAATALLHSVNVLAARGGLRAWTMMLALVAFSMSMVGTFLVRSGILTSVHSFAVDPTRGTFILALLAIYIGGALTLFALRVAHVKEGAPFEVVSREGGLVANNLILSVILGIVFVGTLYPLIAEALSGEKLSVGPPYFDSVASPLALVLAALMFIAPAAEMAAGRRADPAAPGAGSWSPIGGICRQLHPGTHDRHAATPGSGIGAGLLPASLRHCSAVRSAGRRWQPGAWRSRISAWRWPSLEWHPTAPSPAKSWRRRARARRSRSVHGWSSFAGDANRRPQLDGAGGRISRVKGLWRGRPQAAEPLLPIPADHHQ